MTLTEEQRAALKRVAAYMDEMYSVASPYHGCTEDANLLRAMIDSSGTVEPTGGFDLEAARAALVGALKPGGYHDQETARIIHTHMPSLLAEIERLRAENAWLKSDREFQSEEQAARIKSLKKEIRQPKHESKVEVKFTNSYIKRLHDAEARIEELEADLEQSEICIRARMECIDDQAAYIKELESSLDEAETLTKQNAELMNGYLSRIAELEDALVEGLTNFLHYRASCYDPARRCPYAKECDDCSTWDACGHVEMFRSEARQQLQAEGKIGPDATKPRVWQITEERKAALSAMSSLRTDVDCPQCDAWLHFSDIAEHAPVLRTMLREAE